MAEQESFSARYLGKKPVVYLFWALAFAAIPIWIRFHAFAWDVAIYQNAVHALQAGHDPYADAIAVQRLFHSQLALHPNATHPYSYVYSPMTLPLVRLMGSLPLWLSGTLYWLAYAVGALAAMWVAMQALDERERRYFIYFAPAAVFFPGFLEADTILSGNIAYILYGAVFAAAVVGWRRDRWAFFYLVTLAASCFKAPLLSLLAIPVFSAGRQWLPAGLTAAAGTALFAMQPHLWPSLFRNYLTAVELQFSYNGDFGCSPAGILSQILFDHGKPYAPGSIFYLVYALPLAGFLFYLSRRFLRGAFSLEQWIPVLMIGVVLLNPRIKEYDVAPLALPMALIGWRFFDSFAHRRQRTLLWLALFFAVTNAIASYSWDVRTLTNGSLLVSLFAVGSWNLLQHSRSHVEVRDLVSGGVKAFR
jgi:hypothetical protein